MGEDTFAGLRMIDGSAGQISAYGNAHDQGATEVAIGAPADERKFIAHLVHRGPDVVEELDFYNGLETSDGHADGTSDDVGFSERGVPDTIAAELLLQAGG